MSRRLITQSSSRSEALGILREPVEHRRPPRHDVLHPRLVRAALVVRAGPVEVLALEIDGGQGAAVLEPDGLPAGEVAGDLAVARCTGPSRERSRSMKSSSIMLRTMRHRAHLEVVGDVGHVGVADDHVEAAVLLGVGVGLVAGVDDGPAVHRLEADLGLEEVGALAPSGSRSARCCSPPPPCPRRVKIWRDAKKGMRCWTIRAKGTLRSMR